MIFLHTNDTTQYLKSFCLNTSTLARMTYAVSRCQDAVDTGQHDWVEPGLEQPNMRVVRITLGQAMLSCIDCA